MRRPAAPQLRPGRPGSPIRVMPPATASAPAPEPAPAAPRRAPLARTGRRAVLLVGAAAAVSGAAGAGRLTGPFEDVAADHPGAEAIRWAEETGVQSALTATGYSPDAVVTRGDVAEALHRLAGAPPVGLGGLPLLFTDLGEDPARVSAVLWLHGRGALWGDADMRVRPDEPATRDCTAMMLTALLRPALAGVGVTWDAAAEVSLLQAAGPGSALADLAWLEAAGMASWEPTDRAGDAAVTRADLAVSLQRADTVVTSALG
ncbi:MAG: S-layer homology domain-containing protein [Brachybacterium sp.]|nr:S-layer homology domain-containing protein [Brachybacterium sp.]